MRLAMALLLGTAGLCVAASPADPLFETGRTRFEAAEFGKAAGAFGRALKTQPGRADLHYWLGKSEARWADISAPLFAGKHVRRARAHLERAVELEPRNPTYVAELFDLYVDEPVFFPDALDRAAALLERIGPSGFAMDDLAPRLAAVRREQERAGWSVRREVASLAVIAGRAIPGL